MNKPLKPRDRLPILIDDSDTWISYGALEAIHYGMDAEAYAGHWCETPWEKFTFQPLIIDLEKDCNGD